MQAPHQIALDEARNQAYVVEFANPGRLLRIDLTTGVQTTIANNLENAIGLLITQDLHYAYVSEQAASGGRVSRIDLSTKQKQVIVTGRTAPFFMTWVDSNQKAIYLAERDPANRITLLDLSTQPVNVTTVATNVPFRPSSVAILAPGQLLLCSDSVVSQLDLGFDASGPLLLGIGFVPRDRITPAGKADTSVDPAYFFQVKDVPFGGTLPLMLNHKHAYELGARFYQVLVDGVVKTDAWSDYEWNSSTTHFELQTIAPGSLPGKGGGYYPVRTPDQLWLNAWLGDLLSTTNLSNTLHTISVNFVDSAGNLISGNNTVTVLIDNNLCIAGLAVPLLNGLPADPACGTLKYGADKTKQVVMNFTASHPNGFATYSFTLIKGVNTVKAIVSSACACPPSAVFCASTIKRAWMMR
jgi:hypothetical protein